MGPPELLRYPIRDFGSPYGSLWKSSTPFNSLMFYEPSVTKISISEIL